MNHLQMGTDVKKLCTIMRCLSTNLYIRLKFRASWNGNGHLWTVSLIVNWLIIIAGLKLNPDKFSFIKAEFIQNSSFLTSQISIIIIVLLLTPILGLFFLIQWKRTHILFGTVFYDFWKPWVCRITHDIYIFITYNIYFLYNNGLNLEKKNFKKKQW
jgi:hypothetical protein